MNPDKQRYRVMDPSGFEILDSGQLADRLGISRGWIETHTRRCVRKIEQIPHLKFGKFIRFRWNSPKLNDWISRRVQ